MLRDAISEHVKGYDNEFPLKQGEVLMFCESTGLVADQEYLTLISLAYNEDGQGLIRQLLSHAIGAEVNLIQRTAEVLAGFESVVVTSSWFMNFLYKRAVARGIKLELRFKTQQVSIAQMYEVFNPELDGPELARKSRGVYKRFLNGSVDALDEYLEYNRQHTLAYARYMETSK